MAKNKEPKENKQKCPKCKDDLEIVDIVIKKLIRCKSCDYRKIQK